MIPYLITEPAEEPLTVDEAKEHLRVDISDEDTLIGAYLTAARIHYEQAIWRPLITQTLGYRLHQWPYTDYLLLPRPPLQSVTSIAYVDSVGGANTFAASNYNVYVNGDVGTIYLKDGSNWPSTTLQPGPSILITYVAGYGDAEDVKEIDKQAIRLLLGHFYENREDVIAIQGISVTQLPVAVQSIIHLRKAW